MISHHCQTKINYFNLLFWIYENILWFKVTMWDFILVKINKSFCNWFGNVSESLFRERLILLGKWGKRLVTKMLHDNVNGIMGLIRVDNFDNVRMRDVFKYFDLLEDDFSFLLWTHFELFIWFDYTRHIIIDTISISNFSKGTFSNDLIKNIILLLDGFGIFNGWKFEDFLVFTITISFRLMMIILWFDRFR